MPNRSIKSKSILLLAAIIWGFAFAAQKAGMESIGPLAYNGIRYLLGALTLTPLLWIMKTPKSEKTPSSNWPLYRAGLIIGVVMFLASTIQQYGILYTTAGNAGFITSFYVILVPIIGLFFKQKVNMLTWLGVIIALLGLYFLSVGESFALLKGDFLVFGSALFWAIQVILAGKYAAQYPIIKLAILQFTVTGVLSLLLAFYFETFGWVNIQGAMIPILYGGIMSVGFAFTLQLFGQKGTNPTHAAIILSMEAVFAAVGGWLVLGEQLTPRELLGASLMMIGVLCSQLNFKKLGFKRHAKQ